MVRPRRYAHKIASPPIISHTPKIFLDGVSLLAVPGFCLALTSRKVSHTTMPSTSSPEHINLPWMDSSSCLIKQLSQFGVLPIIATGELLLSIRFHHWLFTIDRCGNVASILELDEHLGQEYKVFQHAPIVCIHLLPVGKGTMERTMGCLVQHMWWMISCVSLGNPLYILLSLFRLNFYVKVAFYNWIFCCRMSDQYQQNGLQLITFSRRLNNIIAWLLDSSEQVSHQ